MARAKDNAVRQLFRATLAETKDYREAARVAGVSERTGRRWRQELERRDLVGGPPAFERNTSSPLRPSATSFEGRAGDLVRLTRHFEGGERLVTLFGPPGIGKTRLALEWTGHAARLSPAWSPFFCDLRGIDTAAGFAAKIAHVLGVAFDEFERTQTDILATALAARGRCLLVLDNYDELTTEGAALLGRLLEDANEARFLVTSRRMLKLRKEVVCELAALSLPTGTTPVSEASWLESDAMRLFWARAHAAEPGLRANSLPPETVAKLVRRLDGIPLAIEICAAQLTRVSVQQLFEEITKTLLVLQHDATDTDPRHRTLKAALEYSYRPLSNSEKKILSRLSVFRNGFTKQAALIVAGDGYQASEVEQALASLRERSLLRVEAQSSRDRRWDVLESVRELAGEHLLALEHEAASNRHARYYLSEGERLAHEADATSGSTDRVGLQLEAENLRVAFAWFRQRVTGIDRRNEAAELPSDDSSYRDLGRMALVLQRTLSSWRPDEIVQILSVPLEHSPTHTLAPVLRARLLIARATARREICDFGGAAQDLSTITTEIGGVGLSEPDRALMLAEVAFQRAQIHFFCGEVTSAEASLQVARTSLQQATDSRERTLLEGRIESLAATIQADRHRSPTAFVHYARAVALLERAGDATQIAGTRFWWDAHRLFFGEWCDPETMERRAHELAASGLQVPAGWYTLLAAAHHQNAGQLWEAFQLATTAEKRGACLGVERLRLGAVCILGLLLEEMGDLGEACVRYESAARDYASLGLRYEALARIYLAGAVARLGDVSEAEAEFARVNRLLEVSPDSRFAQLTDLRRGHLELEETHRAIRAAVFDEALDNLQRVNERIASAEKPRLDRDGEKRGLVACSYEARVLVRILRKAIGQSAASSVALRVTSDGSHFAVGSGPMHPVRGGAVVQSMLAALAASRAKQPGHVVLSAELFARCWPGERAQPESQRLRVRVTIRRLREAGLGRVVTTGQRGGYLLDPLIPIELVDDATFPIGGDGGSR